MIFGDSDIKSTGAFLVGELERLDPTLYEPIADFTWGRDIDVREDVTIDDEVTSFMLSEFAGGFGGTGSGSKSWLSNGANAVAQISVGARKVSMPVTPWGQELAYSVFDLQKSQRVGRPIDVQQFDALKFKHQLDIDAQVYIGDAEVGVEGLLNSKSVAQENIGTLAPEATAAEVLDAINKVLDNAWKQTGYTRMPNTMLIAPALFARLAGTQLPATNSSLLKFVLENNIVTLAGVQLNIRSVKWLADKSLFSNDRIVAYTKARDVVRFPLVKLQALPVQFRDYKHIVPYYGALGAVEFVRPEMCYYADLTA